MLSRLRPLLKGVTRSLGIELKRHRPEFPPGVVSLRPDGTPRGIVLLAYILEPFQRRQDTPVTTNHTHHGESLLIAETWLRHGYGVEWT